MPPRQVPPKQYDPRATEARWADDWADSDVYRYVPDAERLVFAIDTPPPTVSGELHVGHVFSYTHTDLTARYQRMRGLNVFYPMGWDDNGLPTERRVQQLMNVRCNPELPYEPGFAPDTETAEPVPVGRRNFIKLCARVTEQDERAFGELWRRLGLSVDWAQTYATINESSRRVSQLAFLDLVRKGEVYAATAPTMWDVDFGTAVAQAEVEDREVKGLAFRLRFALAAGGSFHVMTTRPELLGACVAVVVHPQDARYKRAIGGIAITPGYHVEVPILAHPLVEPDKGTGAVMVCTFGDATDVTWWRELDLPTRLIMGRNGCIVSADWRCPGWESRRPERAQRIHARLRGLRAEEARTRMVALLSSAQSAPDGAARPPLEGKPRHMLHFAQFYEKGERPLEILPTRQWFIRLVDKREALIEQGRRIRWHPEHMLVRYERWVEGLKYDWCVSRQRYHGVPIPVWYPLSNSEEALYDEPIWAGPEQLPVDPMAQAPPGFEEEQRGRPGGFTAETDVLDTWATSSLTPQIAAGWARDEGRFRKLYPMSLRPQAHEIIRTWAFYTIARAYMLDGRVPWRNIAISGWVVDPDRNKMSKSKGNVVTPEGMIDEYGADAVRYWAARARLGADTAYDEGMFRIGKRLVTKLFNAGKLIVGRLPSEGQRSRPAQAISYPLDRAHLALLGEVVVRATAHMEAFETAAALEEVEAWFWKNLCDDYLELTKARAYGGDPSALATWRLSLSAVLRLFAPFLPYITEEVWSWLVGKGCSVHRAQWPAAESLRSPGADPDVFEVATAVVAEVRRAKTEARLSLRAPVERLAVAAPISKLRALKQALGDVLSATAAQEAILEESDDTEMRVRTVLVQ